MACQVSRVSVTLVTSSAPPGTQRGMLLKTLCSAPTPASCGSSLAELPSCPGTLSGAEFLPQERQDPGSWYGFALVVIIWGAWLRKHRHPCWARLGSTVAFGLVLSEAGEKGLPCRARKEEEEVVREVTVPVPEARLLPSASGHVRHGLGAVAPAHVILVASALVPAIASGVSGACGLDSSHWQEAPRQGSQGWPLSFLHICSGLKALLPLKITSEPKPKSP